MKNITVSVPDDIYQQARVTAAKQGTSVSARVTEFLTHFAGEDDHFKAMENRMLEIIDSIDRCEIGEQPTRERTYER